MQEKLQKSSIFCNFMPFHNVPDVFPSKIHPLIIKIDPFCYINSSPDLSRCLPNCNSSSISRIFMRVKYSIRRLFNAAHIRSRR